MKTYLFVAVAAMLVGFTMAWGIYRPKPGPIETPAAEVRQKDGSVILERKPEDAKEAAAIAPPKIDLPVGATIEREVQVTVSQKTPGAAPGMPNLSPTPADMTASTLGPLKSNLNANLFPPVVCPPLHVDLALLRLKDQTQRVVASSPDGSIVGGVDIPVETPKISRPTRWTAAALAGYDSRAARNVWGGEVGYQLGPFVLEGGAIGGTAFVGAGIKF